MRYFFAMFLRRRKSRHKCCFKLNLKFILFFNILLLKRNSECFIQHTAHYHHSLRFDRCPIFRSLSENPKKEQLSFDRKQLRVHSLSTYAKFSEKLIFLTIRGSKMLVLGKILRTYLMDDPLQIFSMLKT